MSKLALLQFPGTETLEENYDLGGGRGSFSLGTSTPADIINQIVPVLLLLAGLILFAMLISGGFTIFLSAGNPEKIKKGQGTLTSAFIGFIIIFAAYWIIQLLQFTFGFKVL